MGTAIVKMFGLEPEKGVVGCSVEWRAQLAAIAVMM